jgi:hypothetical protein
LKIESQSNRHIKILSKPDVVSRGRLMACNVLARNALFIETVFFFLDEGVVI